MPSWFSAEARGSLPWTVCAAPWKTWVKTPFEKHTYYERWIASVNQNLIEAGAYTLEELAGKMDEVAARGASYGEAQGDG